MKLIVSSGITHKIYFVLILLTSFSIFSQNSVDDEFKRLDALCREHMRNPDSLIYYSQKLLDYSKEHDLDRGMMQAYRLLGMSNSRLRNFEKSNNYYYKALNLVNRVNDENFKYIIYGELSTNHRRTEYFDSAVYYSNKIIDHFKLNPDIRFSSYAYKNLGEIYFQKGNLDSAIVYLNKYSQTFKQRPNPRELATNLSLMGEVYYKKEDYQKALKLIDSSQKISESIKFEINYSRNYRLLALINKKLNNDEAFNKYTELDLNYRPKNIDEKNIINSDNNYRSNVDYHRNVIQDLEGDKFYYKSNFLLFFFITIIFIAISIYLYKNSKTKKEEVLLLQKKLDKYIEQKTEEPSELLHLKSKAVIPIETLQYIKSDGHYLEFYIEDKEKPEIDRNSLTNVLDSLHPKKFVRIHNSYIVNIGFIKIINSTKLMLKDGTWIPLSRTYKQHLKKILQIL